jgi:cytosine/adenosine deaminase-related metal-dependent hydrolase
MPMRAVILGRTGAYQDEDQIRENRPPETGGTLEDLLEHCDGVGISGANEHSDAALVQYSKTSKLRAIHAAETDHSVRESLRMTGRREVERALLARPNFLVHMTQATAPELQAASRISGVVACPRSNMALGGKMPDLRGMVAAGCTVALGTDNVMVNSPDMFREMEFAWKGSGGGLDAADVLRMATVNGGRVLGMNVGVIREGAAADYILLERHHVDLDMMHDPHAALVHRAGPGSIRAVVVGGMVAHGRI